jgi:tetratricopeptide (TPR) repeat protein
MRVWELDPPTPELTRQRWLETQADRLVGSLIVRDADAVDATAARLQGDASLEGPVRAAALRRSRLTRGNAQMADNRAWGLARTPNRSAAEYRSAYELAEIAWRSDPEDRAYVNTLGVALYRLGRYPEALEMLERSARLNASPMAGRIPEELAFLAMTHQRLGHTTLARALLERLRGSIKTESSSQQEEAQALLRECESTVMSP